MQTQMPDLLPPTGRDQHQYEAGCHLPARSKTYGWSVTNSGTGIPEKGLVFKRTNIKRSNSLASELDLEAHRVMKKGIKDHLKKLDGGISGGQLSNSHSNNNDPLFYDTPADTDSSPPEWALLLIGCFLGLATGIFVAAFNQGVHVIHEWAWAGTPNEGATWLRLQQLGDTWQRILLIPLSGGVVVGMMHGLLEIMDQMKQSSPRDGFDVHSGVLFPTIKALQAAVALGTGCSLGPEGPSVDIGKSCANGCSELMGNSRERRIAFVAAGAAAGIASGFNVAVAGCFFAIETILRPLRAENSPPFTTAMIILASVISSTVTNILVGETPAFTVPTYELKSAAELPLYLVLGMLCGIVSVAFTRLVAWSTKSFVSMKERGLPAILCPALGGLGAGIIALRYPGTLYWGFTNVDEILHTGKSVSAPGIWLLTQLAGAKVVATALCKGSGLIGGLYAPSLMIGAAVGAVFGGSAAELINFVDPANAAIAQSQAYALVGMAATLASVCSVPLTSILLLFELTKDYRIFLPLMGAVGLAIWVPSVTIQSKETEAYGVIGLAGSYSSLSPVDEDINKIIWRGSDNIHVLELLVPKNAAEEVMLDALKVSQAMSKNYLKVSPIMTLKDTILVMHNSQQNCVLVTDAEDLLEGIVTLGDIQRRVMKLSGDAVKNNTTVLIVNTCLVSSISTRGINYRGHKRGLLTCYADTDLTMAKELMETKGIKQLPVVRRGGDFVKERKRRVIGLLHYDSIQYCLREEMNHHTSIYLQPKDDAIGTAIDTL